MSGGRVAYVRHAGHAYPARHWAKLSRFAVGDERDPRDLFRLADDTWDAWPYAEGGRPTNAFYYRFNFGMLRSFLKPYVKWYCYERLLMAADTSWSRAKDIIYTLKRADSFIIRRGFTSIDDIAPQAVFQKLWVANITQPAAADGTHRTKAEVKIQSDSRLFWLRLRSHFGVPKVIPPTAPHFSKLPTEYADDKSKVIPEHIINQLVNRLALHRDGLKPLNRFNHLRLCVVILAICLGRRIGELLSATRGSGPDGPLSREPARDGTEQGALWFRYKPSKRGPATKVYISAEWEDVATYCVRQLVNYGDEIREAAHPAEAGLLILVSGANLTAGMTGACAPSDATPTQFQVGAGGHPVRGLTNLSLKLWMNGSEATKRFNGALKRWGVTVDGTAGGAIYKLSLGFARHTRQSALALDPQVSLLTRQRDLNHNDTNAQFAYQHRLAESHDLLLRRIGEGKMCGGGMKWLTDLLGNKIPGFSEGSPTAMTPRWRAIVQNNPLFLQLNRVPCGFCVLPKGPSGCTEFLNCTGAKEGGCPCLVVDSDDARILSELDRKASTERRRQLESAAAGRTVQAGKHEVQARRAEELRDEAMRLASTETLAELRQLQDETAEEDLWGDG